MATAFSYQRQRERHFPKARTVNRSRAHRFWRDQSGGVAMMYAITLPGLIGLAGLGVETGYWYFDKRELQTEADAGALGGAWELAWNRTSHVKPSATNEAVRNGFPNSALTTITVNDPPTSGSQAGNKKAVEVILTQDYDPLFSGIFRTDSVTIAARAVATLVASGSACVLALNGTVSDAAETSGSAKINAPDCTIAANSTSESAISFSGSSDILFKSAWTQGGIETGNTTDLTLTDGARTHMWPLDDPYADLNDTAPSGCMPNINIHNGTTTVGTSGGVRTVCNDIHVTNGETVDFQPGTYWMKGSSLNIEGGTVQCSSCEPGGDGVTFIFTTPNNGNVNQIGTVTINGNATVQLNAPGSGDYKGVLFFQDPDAPTDSNKTANLNGGANTVLNGAIYFRNNEVQWAGNNSLAATCTLIVADTVTFTGDSGLTIDDCASQGIDLAFTQKVTLVE